MKFPQNDAKRGPRARQSLRHYNLRLGELPKAHSSASQALAILREMQQAEMPKDPKGLLT